MYQFAFDLYVAPPERRPVGRAAVGAHLPIGSQNKAVNMQRLVHKWKFHFIMTAIIANIAIDYDQ